jgi:subfamily B ATP-binding cassette protein MsbA
MSMEGGTLAGMSYMLQPMFDQVMVKGEEGAIWLVATVIFFLFLTRGVTGLIHRTILAKVSFNSSTQMQEDLLGHTLNLDNNFHSKEFREMS